MSEEDRSQNIIEFVDIHFKNKINKDTYLFVKELYEYISFLYDCSAGESDLTSESESEEVDDTVKETLTYAIDQTGFYSLT